jgi:hypothetical protein
VFFRAYVHSFVQFEVDHLTSSENEGKSACTRASSKRKSVAQPARPSQRRVIRSAFRSAPRTPILSRDPPLALHTFTRMEAHATATGEVLFSRSESPEQILIATDVHGTSINREAEGYIGSGFTKIAVYARLFTILIVWSSYASCRVDLAVKNMRS